MKSLLLIALALALAVLSGCATRMTFPVITPVSPPPSADNFYPKVDSTRPTFRWQPLGEVVHTYDLVIYESLQASYFSASIFHSTNLVGRPVYFREGLVGTEHTIEKSLPGGRKYFWSVRAHQNDRVTPWATYNFHSYGNTGENQYFGFETPS